MYLVRNYGAAGALALAAAFAFVAGDAGAQQIYRIVGPDGRITFSDRAPTDPSVQAKSAPVVPLPANGGSGLASLPFELRQAAARYPVTLYTSAGCNTCIRGRALLVSRGIPFSEKTVTSKEDGEALSRLTGAMNVPVLTIGGQQLKGFSDAEWTQFLDAAGYPKTSLLPPSYAPAPATPLVALDQRAAPAPATQQPAPSAPAAAQGRDGPQPENPAGITF